MFHCAACNTDYITPKLSAGLAGRLRNRRTVKHSLRFVLFSALAPEHARQFPRSLAWPPLRRKSFQGGFRQRCACVYVRSTSFYESSTTRTQTLFYAAPKERRPTNPLTSPRNEVQLVTPGKDTCQYRLGRHNRARLLFRVHDQGHERTAAQPENNVRAFALQLNG